MIILRKHIYSEPDTMPTQTPHDSGSFIPTNLGTEMPEPSSEIEIQGNGTEE